jgi:hypothetical protein
MEPSGVFNVKLLKDQRVHKVFKDRQAQQAQQVRKDYKVLMDQQARQVRYQLSLDQQDLKVLKV